MLVYVDTSVFGGAFDTRFADDSVAFFDRVRNGMIEVGISALVLNELAHAPATVNQLFDELEPLLVRVDIDDEAYALRRAYLDAQVVTAKWAADALHVAAATVSGCRAIVSWNFKHIVNFRRIPLYNGANQMQGYGPIAIHTPPEVSFYEED
ncbi:MAG TPA: PIN domain-containing protein [Candidatus Hydrogenedentes bacterium]|nr:PIN domain-containing protein [Candidatus Hydrogenedentota bacterium]HPG65768.1 PIN domain-containing protein [Candidatus Hydrogenedentota bacterium]